MSKDGFNIKNFFVGELYFSYPFSNILEESVGYNRVNNQDRAKMYQSIYELCNNGAISSTFFSKKSLSNVDSENRREYYGVLTLFHKNNEKCVCLHDGNVYNKEGNSFYSNLTPLTSLFPKVDFDTPDILTIKEALIFFKILLKGIGYNRIPNLYNNVNHSISEFFVGRLALYNSFSLDKPKCYEYQSFNLPTKIILMKNNIKSYSGFIVSSPVNGDESLKYEHSFSNSFCIFLRQNQQYYNIGAHQFYENRLYSRKEINDLSTDKSYCEIDMTLDEYLEIRGLSSKRNKELSIRKATKLFRKAR